jgi:DNA-binding transcriptional regulator YiaG
VEIKRAAYRPLGRYEMDGSKLREIRDMLGLQQDEIAEFLGVNNETVCRWERGNLELKKMVSDAIQRLTVDPVEVNRLKAGRHARKIARREKRLRRS